MKKKTLIISSIIISLVVFVVGVTAGDLGLVDKFFGDETDLDLRSSDNTKLSSNTLQEICDKSRIGTNYVASDVVNSKGEVILEAGTEIKTCWVEG